MGSALPTIGTPTILWSTGQITLQMDQNGSKRVFFTTKWTKMAQNGCFLPPLFGLRPNVPKCRKMAENPTKGGISHLLGCSPLRKALPASQPPSATPSPWSATAGAAVCTVRVHGVPGHVHRYTHHMRVHGHHAHTRTGFHTRVRGTTTIGTRDHHHWYTGPPPLVRPLRYTHCGDTR